MMYHFLQGKVKTIVRQNTPFFDFSNGFHNKNVENISGTPTTGG